MAVKPIPDGFRTVTPYLIMKGTNKAIEFYKKALGAEKIFTMKDPDGKIVHAEIKVGDSIIMLGEEVPAMDANGPKALGGSPVGIMLYVDDADALFERAVEAGAKVKQPMADQFYGDRNGTVEDPFGHIWSFATHIEDVTREEVEKRFAAMSEGDGSKE